MHIEAGDGAPTVDTLRRRAAGAAIGLAIVIATYDASRYGDGDRYWAAAVTILLAVLLADVLPDVRALLPIPGMAPLTIVAVLVAAGLCVPETDQLVVASILPGVVVALELVHRRQVGLEWYAIAAASVGWAAMFGATGRQSALVGALFAWWPIVLVWLVQQARPMRALPARVAVTAVGVAAAIVMARTGGIADSWDVVVAAGLATGGVSLAVSLAIANRGRRAGA